MWSFLLIGLLAATVIVLVGANLRQRRLIEALKRAREELQVEEDRVFDFLHGLGEAFSENLRSSDLHRLIVEGATRITDAHGGTLYLVDRTGSWVVPFIGSTALLLLGAALAMRLRPDQPFVHGPVQASL